jgi:hypothetical protein
MANGQYTDIFFFMMSFSLSGPKCTDALCPVEMVAEDAIRINPPQRNTALRPDEQSNREADLQSADDSLSVAERYPYKSTHR